MTQHNGPTSGRENLPDAHVADVAKQAAKFAVQETFLLIGIDLSDPIGAQHTFATLHEVAKMAQDPEFRRDLEHMRAWRKTVESIRDKTLIAVVGVVITALAAALWAGFRSFVK